MEFNVLSYVKEAKEEFDRTVACKHTAFDDLYPYMMEHQSFFWYKRHAAWSSLLTAVHIADGMGAAWSDLFDEKQQTMLSHQILDKKVLDEWLEMSENDLTAEPESTP